MRIAQHDRGNAKLSKTILFANDKPYTRNKGLYGGGRNGRGRREKWPKKVGRREKSGRKCREQGEIKCWE